MGVLVVTHESGSGEAARIEVMDALLPKDAGMRVELTHHEGVLLARTCLGPLLAHDLIFSSLPRHISKVVPVELECEPNTESIGENALILAKRKFRGSFMVRCRSRGSGLDAARVEQVVGARLRDRTGASVDLENPDFVVYIEVVGGFAGVSIFPLSFPISMKSVREDIVSSMRYISQAENDQER